MRIELDKKGNFVDATNIRFHKKVADVTLGIQRGVDVYFRFETQMNKLLTNERCLHFTSLTTPWSDEKCLQEVVKRIESGELIKTQINYPPKTEEPI